MEAEHKTPQDKGKAEKQSPQHRYKSPQGKQSPREKENIFRRYFRLRGEIKNIESQIKTQKILHIKFRRQIDNYYELLLKMGSSNDLMQLLKDSIKAVPLGSSDFKRLFLDNLTPRIEDEFKNPRAVIEKAYQDAKDGRTFCQTKINELSAELEAKQAEFKATCKKPLIRVASIALATTVTLTALFAYPKIKQQQNFNTLWEQRVPQLDKNNPQHVINATRDILHQNVVNITGLNINPSLIATFVDTDHVDQDALHPASGTYTNLSIGIISGRTPDGEPPRGPSGEPIYSKRLYDYYSFEYDLSDGSSRLKVLKDEMPEDLQKALRLLGEAQDSGDLDDAIEAFEFAADMDTSYRGPKLDYPPEYEQFFKDTDDDGR